jgi:hypothetical protein
MINEMKTRIKTVFNNYKGHLIWTSVAKDPRTNRWKFFSQVLWSDVGEFKSFPSQLSYHTEAEANWKHCHSQNCGSMPESRQ